jgi:phenylacetate-CoA ligase
VPLPFVWIFGRRDATISIMGANIYPEDVEAAIYGDPAVAAAVRSFQLTVLSDDADTPRPGVLLELNEGIAVTQAWRAERVEQIRDGVAALSRDYRTSLDEYPEAMQPMVETFALGTGPFEADAERIKQRRIAAD